MEAIEAILSQVAQGLLEIRADGTIWRLATKDRTGRATAIEPRRTETTLKSGYLSVKVCIDGRQYWATAHRVVWTHVNGPIPESMQINHIDGVKSNNSPSNLELVTPSENLVHAYRTGLMQRPRIIPEPILHKHVTRAKELRSMGLSYNQIGKSLGISQTTAFRAVRFE